MSYCFVYIVGVVDNPVKIGVAANVKKRLESLQIGCPDQLQVFHALRVLSHSAQPIEAAAHRALGEHHRRGEWFNVSAALAWETVVAVGKPIADELSYRLRVDGSLLNQLRADFPVDPCAEDFLRWYKKAMNDPGRRPQLLMVKRAVLERCGRVGLTLFTMAFEGGGIPGAMSHADVSLARRARAETARALNVACEARGNMPTMATQRAA